jgi:hypothetical protein
MDELIARLEAATVPDPILDWEIVVACHGSMIIQWGRGDIEEPLFAAIEHAKKHDSPMAWVRKAAAYALKCGSGIPPAYTASIDAALTLVPEDKYWRVAHVENMLIGGDWVVTLHNNALPYDAGRHQFGRAATAAIALCIAALRARARPHTAPAQGE